jgi:formylglycine-generating enzyme required for sulfatase activity
MRCTWRGWTEAVVLSATILAATGCSGYSVHEPKQPGEDHPPGPVAGEVITNSIGMRLVYVSAGEFAMGGSGSAAALAARYGGRAEHFANEFPSHRVIIREGFWMGETEVTQGEYRSVMKVEPWLEKPYVRQADYYPAVFVSWEDAAEFCRKLSEREDRPYLLPTEAQWEYACRAGTTTEYSFGDDAAQSDDFAWFKGNTLGIGEPYAQPVALLKPNGFGLYDMHGNVWEWCRDYYDGDYYAKVADPAIDPENTLPAPARVLRGGCWYYEAQYGRAAYRGGSTPPGRRNVRIGFRVILVGAGPRQSLSDGAAPPIKQSANR